MILTAIEPPSPTDMGTSDYNQIKQIWEEFDRERRRFLTNDPVPGENWTFNLEGRGYSFSVRKDDPSALQYYNQLALTYETLLETSEPQIPHAQNYYRFVGRQTLNASERTWLVRKPALEAIYVRPAAVKSTLLKFSPVGIYDAATQAWAGTDFLGIRDFFKAVREYQRTVTDYFYDTDAFGARQWFSADKGAVDWNSIPQGRHTDNSLPYRNLRHLRRKFTGDTDSHSTRKHYLHL